MLVEHSLLPSHLFHRIISLSARCCRCCCRRRCRRQLRLRSCLRRVLFEGREACAVSASGRVRASVCWPCAVAACSVRVFRCAARVHQRWSCGLPLDLSGWIPRPVTYLFGAGPGPACRVVHHPRRQPFARSSQHDGPTLLHFCARVDSPCLRGVSGETLGLPTWSWHRRRSRCTSSAEPETVPARPVLGGVVVADLGPTCLRRVVCCVVSLRSCSICQSEGFPSALSRGSGLEREAGRGARSSCVDGRVA